jgi:CRISPR/Cas system CSM-associated protein Csm3 (group 7 of RAMP superfamily)
MISEKRYKVELETIEPLRVGGVEDPRSGIHNPVTKVADKVVIPGSSLKGALRSEIEQFLIETYYGKASQDWSKDDLAFQPCIPAPRPTTDEQSLIDVGKYRSEACHYPCEFEERFERGRRVFRGKCTKGEQPTPHSICPICYFLGAMGLPGFVRVPFLFTDISPEELYSSRIDRAISTVVEGTNRPYQLVPSGIRFSGELVIITEDPVAGWKIGDPRPLKDKTLGDQWLEQEKRSVDELIDIYIIERLKNIKILGGYKSKGFGQVKIDVTPLKT